MKCVICKNGVTYKGNVTVTLERNKSIVLIKNVPAKICNNCGDYYLSEKIAELVLKQGEEAIKNGAELEVTKLKMAI